MWMKQLLIYSTGLIRRLH
ncbi:hypothetical protein Gotur_028982 [Gossypium turneri]